MNKIHIYKKPDGDNKLSTGANTVVEINGQKIPYCTKVNVSIEAGGIAKVTLELLGELEVTVDAEGLEKVGTRVLHHSVPVISEYQAKIV